MGNSKPVKIVVVCYEPEHAYEMLARNVREENLFLSDYPEWEQWALDRKDGGPSFTLLADGKVVASAGVVLGEWNKGVAWLLWTTLFYKYVKSTFKAVKQGLEAIIAEHELQRVETMVNPESEENIRFVSHLGFENAGLQKKYGPKGEDFLLYARVE